MKLYKSNVMSVLLYSSECGGGSAEGHVQKWHFPQQLSLKDQ